MSAAWTKSGAREAVRGGGIERVASPDLGPLWHALGGAAITAAVALAGIPGLLVVLLVGGWLREVLQHDPWLTPWQWIEALAWSVGGAVAWALVGLLT